MSLNVNQFLRKINVFHSPDVLYTQQSSDAGYM